MPNVPVRFSGDASGVEGAAAAAQAAIDRVHGKTETVEINVKVNGNRALGAAAKNMDAFAKASNDAMNASERHAAASERASAGARDHASAAVGASRGLRDHATALEQSSSAARDHASASGGAATALRDHGVASGDASRGVQGLGDSHRYSRGEAQGFTRAMVAGGLASADFAKSVSGLMNVGAQVSEGMGAATKASSGFAKGVNSLSEVSSGLNVMGTASSAVQMFGTAALYGAAGSGILTAAVGALGVVGVGALGGVGLAAGIAGGAMASFTADAHKDSAKFGDTFKQMGQQAHLGAQMISEPMAEAMVGMGRSMVNAQNQMTPAGMGIANSLKTGFGEAASVITGNSDAIVDAAGAAASGFARLTGEAAPGVSAFLGQLPGLTQGAASGASQMTSEFGRAAGNIEGATPALNRMMGAAGGLGAELVHIGSGSMVPFAEDMASMTRSATRMASQMEPAIKPSMSAFADLANAGMGAIGGLSGEVADFAGTVSNNVGPLGSILGAAGRGMLGLGTGVVQGLAEAAPGIDNLGTQTGRYAPAIGRDAGRAGGVFSDALAGGEQMLGWATESGESLKSGVDAALGVQRNAKGGVDLSTLGGGQGGMGGMGAGAVQHGVHAYTHPVDAFKEAFGVGQPGGGGAAPVGPAAPGIADQRATGMGNMVAKAGMAPQASTISAPVPAAQVATGAAQVGAGAAPAFNASPVNPGAMAAGAGGFGAAASQMQSLGQAAQAAHAPVAQVGAAMASGAAQVSAAPMAAAMSKTVSRAVDVGAGAAAAGGASVGGALGGGIGVGITSTQTVTDTIMRKHVLKVIDAGAAAGDIHSPSRKTRKMIGQPLGQGTALGVEDTFGQNRDAMGDLLGHYANENKPAPVVTVSGGSRPTQEPRDSAIPGADSRLSGVAKQMAFGENPDAIAAGGARAVYDKQVMSWEAKPGVDITKIHDMAELNNSIQSPLNARQYGAMNAMQDNLDQPGLSRNSQMFGQRTQQNIMRNRPGAFDVAGQWADHTADQKDQAKALGENSADGQVNGMKSRFPQAFGAGEQLASQAQLGYKKKDQQNSPSAVWAGMAGNSVAGAVGGMNAGGPVMAMAGAGMASAAQAGAIGPLTDYGLKAGNTYVQAFSDGVSREITKGNFANLGEPANLGAGAMSKLAGTGLLRAGSGAATYKTPSGASGVVTLPPAITLNLVGAPIHLDGERIATIADQRIELAFDQATNTYQTL